MSLQLTQTNNTKQDINNIINGINTQFNSDAISNVLNITAYGNILITVPNTTSTNTVATFRHNLGYAPMFMAWVNNFGVFIPISDILGNYVYAIADPKSGGAYPYSVFNVYADVTFFNVEVFNAGNPFNFAISGTFTIFYILFSRPITG